MATKCEEVAETEREGQTSASASQQRCCEEKGVRKGKGEGKERRVPYPPPYLHGHHPLGGGEVGRGITPAHPCRLLLRLLCGWIASYSSRPHPDFAPTVSVAGFSSSRFPLARLRSLSTPTAYSCSLTGASDGHGGPTAIRGECQSGRGARRVRNRCAHLAGFAGENELRFGKWVGVPW